MKPLKLLLFTFAILSFSCSDNDELKPISLIDREGTTIHLTYPNEDSYSFPLAGGDGNYSIKSCDDKIVKAEMVSATDFRLTIVAIGKLL